MSGPGLSHDGLHVLLWEKRTGSGTVRIQQTRYCEDLQITRYTLNRVLKTMELAGRIRSLTKGRGSTIKTYVVSDPAAWFAEHAEDETDEDGDTDDD